MEQLDGSCLPGVVLFHLFLRFCARRALKTREGQVIAMRDFSIRKKPYTKPEIQEIGPKDLAALVREKLTESALLKRLLHLMELGTCVKKQSEELRSIIFFAR